MSTAAVNAAYRSRLLDVRDSTYRDLLRIWPAFNPNDLDAYAAWATGAAAIIRRDHARQAALATGYLSAHAFAAGVDTGLLRPADRLVADQVETSLRVTSLVAYAKARQAGKQAEEALQVAYVRSSGAATRLSLMGGRSVITNTTTHDRRYAGWRRTGSPKCRFCRDLIGRGAIYKESTASFDAHDHCSCGAEPAYR